MGGASKSKQSSSSQQQSFNESFIAGYQQPLLERLGGAAQQLAFGQLPAIQSQAADLGRTLQRSGNAFLGGIGQISQGQLGQGFNNAIGGLAGLLPPELGGQIQDRLLGSALPGQSTLEALAGGGATLSGNSLLQSAGQGFQDLISGPNPGLQGSLDALDAALQRNLESTAGTIAGQASLAGQAGGSRQALATGLAAEETSRQFAQGASSLISQDFAGRQQLAPALLQGQISAGQALNQGDLGLMGSSLSAAQALQAGGVSRDSALLQLLGTGAGALEASGQLGLGGNQLQTTAGLGGIDALPQLMNLGLSPFQAAFSPLLNFAQILGPATVLSRGESSGSSKSSGSSVGFSVGAGG